MSKEERKLKAKVDEYFEKYMCVSFDKFIENWEDLERYSKEQDKILQQKENIIKGLDNTIENLEEVVEQKENIIKEVREYANNIMFETKAEEKIQDDILEILDKGE